VLAGLAADAFRSRDELIAENALLRQQLIVAARANARCMFKPHERALIVFWASVVRHWRSAVLVVQPETVLRWHRHGFRLFWGWKSRRQLRTEPRIKPQTVDLIRTMARDNRLWGAERIRGELLKLGIRVAKYGGDFDRGARGVGARVLKTPVRAPKANAFCERFLGSVRRECLDHVLVFGERQLLEILLDYVRYFDQARTHQGIGQLVPAGSSTAAAKRGAVTARPVLNGLHHDYRRAA
jgi:transposase InsO family protein